MPYAFVPFVLSPTLLLLIYCSSLMNIKYKKIFTFATLFLFILMLSIVAYGITPPSDYYVDFDRIKGEIDLIQTEGINSLKEIYSTSPLSVYLLYSGYLLGDINVIKFISSFIMYSCLFYIAFKEWESNKYSSITFLVSILYILSTVNLPGLVLGVRQGPALSLAALGAYVGLSENKRLLGFLTIIISSLLHISCILVIIAFLISVIKNRRIRHVLEILIFAYTIISFYIASIFSNNDFFGSMLSKMNSYYIFGDNYDLFTTPFNQIFSIIIILSLSTLFLICKNLYITKNDYYIFYFVILLFCIGSLATSTPLRRYTLLAQLAAIPYINIITQQFIDCRSDNDIIELNRRKKNMLYIATIFVLLIIAAFSLLNLKQGIIFYINI